MYPAEAFIDVDHLSTNLANAIGATINLSLDHRPLDWSRPDQAQLMRSAHAKLNTGIGSIPELIRLLTGETTDTLVFIAVATGSATIEQLAELLETDQITLTERLRREEGRRLDALGQALAELTPASRARLQLIATGVAVDNLPQDERSLLAANLADLSAAMHEQSPDTVHELFTAPWFLPWRPSVLINLDRQIRELSAAPSID